MMGRQRRRLSEGSWHDVMRRFEVANMTVGEFCALEGLSQSCFYRWRAQMTSSSDVLVPAPPRRAQAKAAQPSPSGFIELGTLPGSSREVSNNLELRLELGGGLVLQIVRR